LESVTGIGGLFIRAKEPQKLSAWYEKHLGVTRVPQTYEERSWWQDEGPTVFDAFDEDNEYFGNYAKPWIINFRVRDLDAMVKQLQAAGIDVAVDPERYPNGRFASLFDPEGNPIQLWQPEGTDLIRPQRT
jgi:glyoxylase I family protein